MEQYFVEFCKAVGAPPPRWLYDIPLPLPPVLTSASPWPESSCFCVHDAVGWCQRIFENEHYHHCSQSAVGRVYMLRGRYES